MCVVLQTTKQPIVIMELYAAYWLLPVYGLGFYEFIGKECQLISVDYGCMFYV